MACSRPVSVSSCHLGNLRAVIAAVGVRPANHRRDPSFVELALELQHLVDGGERHLRHGSAVEYEHTHVSGRASTAVMTLRITERMLAV